MRPSHVIWMGGLGGLSHMAKEVGSGWRHTSVTLAFSARGLGSLVVHLRNLGDATSLWLAGSVGGLGKSARGGSRSSALVRHQGYSVLLVGRFAYRPVRPSYPLRLMWFSY